MANQFGFNPDELNTAAGGSQIGSLNDQQKGMLQLTMLSKRMEMEAQNRQAEQAQAIQGRLTEMQKQHELSMVPGEQVGALANLMQRGNRGALTGLQLPEHLAGATLQGIGAGNKIPGDTPVKTGVDANGHETWAVFNRRNGEWENATPPPNQGLTQKAQDELAAARKSYGEINGILDSVDNLSKRVISAAGASNLVGQALTNRVNQFLQNDQGAAKVYNDELLGHTQRYEKLITNNGRLNSDLVHGAVAGMPNMLTDIQSTREDKMRVLRGLNTNMLSSSFSAWNQPLPQDLLQQQGATQPKVDPQAQAQQMAMQDWQRRQALKKMPSQGQGNGQ